MQNRLATAIMMSVGGALARRETNGTMKVQDSLELLDDIVENTQALLTGKTVNCNGYPPMKLSGENAVQRSYNNIVASLLKSDDVFANVEGYTE